MQMTEDRCQRTEDPASPCRLRRGKQMAEDREPVHFPPGGSNGFVIYTVGQNSESEPEYGSEQRVVRGAAEVLAPSR